MTDLPCGPYLVMGYMFQGEGGKTYVRTVAGTSPEGIKRIIREMLFNIPPPGTEKTGTYHIMNAPDCMAFHQ